jgi:uncharacterized protein YdeI (YjbR/CyaY-like superfamily)
MGFATKTQRRSTNGHESTRISDARPIHSCPFVSIRGHSLLSLRLRLRRAVISAVQLLLLGCQNTSRMRFPGDARCFFATRAARRVILPLVKTVAVKSRAAWRSWLESHHDSEPAGVWLEFRKGDAAKNWLTYDEAVEEALCFGWIDSIIKRVDDATYVRKFTPRRKDSVWSPSNKERVARLIVEGRMTPVGLALIEAAKANGNWERDPRAAIPTGIAAEFTAALARNEKAGAVFAVLSPSCRRQYVGWIGSAKRPETRARRVQESIALLERGQKLGMK